MIKDEQTFELIERYINKELEGPELNAFQQRLRTEPALLAELNLHEELQESFGDSKTTEFKHILEKIGAKHLALHKQGKKTAKIRPLKWFAYAAAVLGLIACSWLVFNYATQTSTDALFTANYTVYKLDSQNRSEARITNNSAITAYQNKNYGEAATQFENILQNEADNAMARFYLGNCYLETGEFQQALHAYQQVYAKANLYTTQAKWYAALTHLKLNDKASAKSLLLPLSKTQGKYALQAKNLLKEF